MGLKEKELINRLEEIFANPANFDESGWAMPGFVTVELAEGLMKYLQEWGVMAPKLLRKGFGVKIFKADCSEGIIAHRAHSRGFNYMLRLYFDQTYPKEIEKKEREKDERRRYAGNDQQPEADNQGTQADRGCPGGIQPQQQT